MELGKKEEECLCLFYGMSVQANVLCFWQGFLKLLATMQTVRLASYSWLFRPYEDPVEGRLYPRKVLA